MVWLVKFAWIRACVKARLPDDQDQQECKAKKSDSSYLKSTQELSWQSFSVG